MGAIPITRSTFPPAETSANVCQSPPSEQRIYGAAFSRRLQTLRRCAEIAVSGNQRTSTRRVLSSGLSPNNSRYCEPTRPACQKPLSSATDFTVLRLPVAPN